MRMGKYWNEQDIDKQTRSRIEKILTGEYDETIRTRVREKAIHLTDISFFPWASFMVGMLCRL